MATPDTGKDSRLSLAAQFHAELLGLDRCFIDPSIVKVSDTYQRQVKKKLVTAIRSDFCAAAFSTPVLGRRSTGHLWCVDGQQRITASIGLLPTIPVVIFESLGPEHEASVFLYLNRNRLRVSAEEIFKAAHREGDYAMRAILKIVHAHGFNFQCFAKKNIKAYPNIKAINVIQSIYNMDGTGEHLGDFLAFLRAAWPGNKGSLQGPIMHGLAYFLLKFGHKINRPAFIGWLSSKGEREPKAILEKAKLRPGGGRYIDLAKHFFGLYHASRIRPKLTDADFDAVFIKSGANDEIED